jgi:site-specific DNA-cytosine methylase
MEKENIKVLSLFSGYGTDCFALKRLGIEHEVVGYSDIQTFKYLSYME